MSSLISACVVHKLHKDPIFACCASIVVFHLPFKATHLNINGRHYLFSEKIGLNMFLKKYGKQHRQFVVCTAIAYKHIQVTLLAILIEFATTYYLFIMEKLNKILFTENSRLIKCAYVLSRNMRHLNENNVDNCSSSNSSGTSS